MDGGCLKLKTAEMYITCMNRTLRDACNGSLQQLIHYPKWSEPMGFLSHLKESLSPATVSTHLHALMSFMQFTETPSGRQFLSLPKHIPTNAIACFRRWNSSLRKEREEQRVAVVSERQTIIPVVAQNMKDYKCSDQYL